MRSKDDNYTMDEIELGIHEAIERVQNNRQYGLLTLYFPTMSQLDADDLADEIEAILQNKLGIEVFVDYA